MSPYKRLTLEARALISAMRSIPILQKRMAEHLGYSEAAISQELKRNSNIKGYYNHQEAQNQTKLRQKRKYKKPVQDSAVVQEFVLKHLKDRRSPKQIEIMARRKNLQVSKSTIYNFIERNPELKKYRKHRKYRKHSLRLSSRHGIPNRIGIERRPKESTERLEIGHLEMDFIVGSGQSGYILSARDRKIRYPFLIKLENKSEDSTRRAIENYLISWGAKTFSTDNDKSFVCHTVIASLYNVLTYFTRPGAPYEKGSIEQLNKEARVFFPKKTDLRTVNQADLDRVVEILRNTPMKCLDWRTPEEALQEEISCDTG